jgi:hypothetical protein
MKFSSLFTFHRHPLGGMILIALMATASAQQTRHHERALHRTGKSGRAQQRAGARATGLADVQVSIPDGLTPEVRELQGFAIAPVPLNLDGRDVALVGLGSYLVNGGGYCYSCHTQSPWAEGGNPFLGQPAKINAKGYLGGGAKFGTITSRNLTPEPDSDNLPAGMELDEFIDIMRTGVDSDQKHPQISPLLQVMPWPSYSRMTDFELRAIYEYLSAIPPVDVPGAH